MIDLGNYQKIGSYGSFFERFTANMLNVVKEKKKNELDINNLDPAYYLDPAKENQGIIICPEPIHFVKQITSCGTSVDRQQKFTEILQELKPVKPLSVDSKLWFNTTKNGINLRLGNYNSDSGDQMPVTLGDNSVHGVIVGRTGSGKSVLLNNIILNLSSEYSPWEIDLFLIDMKKVELARYMREGFDGGYMTPHVKACGATSEVRYVVSLLKHIHDSMKARQDLFASVGIQKISDFREKYSKELGREVVLPRILLIVDEFQQLYLESKSSERRALETYITAITKLGRATGVHLLFASQEMSNALSSKDLANFKLRIALSCDPQVSEFILGNTDASNIGKGTTLANIEGGNGEKNLFYQTPNINNNDTDEHGIGEFEQYLERIYKNSLSSGYHKVQKFYQEDTQENVNVISKLKSNSSVMSQINRMKEFNPALVDAFVVGTGVLYSDKKNDYESFFLQKGKKGNIGIICSQDLDIASTLKMFTENFKCSTVKFRHCVVYESEIMRSFYPGLVQDLKENGSQVQEMNYSDLIKNRSQFFKSILRKIDYSAGFNKIFFDFIVHYLNEIPEVEFQSLNPMKSRIKRESFLNWVKKEIENITYDSSDPVHSLTEYLKNVTANHIITAFNHLKNDSIANNRAETERDKELFEINVYFKTFCSVVSGFQGSSKHANPKKIEAVELLVKSSKEGKYIEDDYTINWLIGTDNLEKTEDKTLGKISEFCSNNNEFFIFACYDPSNLEATYRCCNYIFLNVPNEHLYSRFKISYTKKSEMNRTIDFKIVNYNVEKSYKQFMFSENKIDIPELSFDSVDF